jgi:hypothetical protein
MTEHDGAGPERAPNMEQYHLWSALGRRGNAPRKPVFRNRSKIALPAEFGHRSLQSKGAWGVRSTSHPCYSAPPGPDKAGLFRGLHSRQYLANAAIAASRVAG